MRSHDGAHAGDLQDSGRRCEKAWRDATERAEVSQTAGKAEFMQEDIRIADGAFEECLGYKFSTKELLERALTHSSAVPNCAQQAPKSLSLPCFPGTMSGWSSSEMPSSSCLRANISWRLFRSGAKGSFPKAARGS